MSLRLTASTLAAAFALAGCGGGGATSPAAPASPAASSPPTVTPQGHGSIPMSFSFPRKTTSSSARRPRYLSIETASLAIYDGTTLVYVANVALDSTPQFTTVYAATGNTTVAPGSCSFTTSNATCGLTITSTIGAHAFDVITYPESQDPGKPAGAPPTFTGVILSEGELSVSLSPGTNAAQSLHLNGVADQVSISGPANAPFNEPQTFGYQIEDSGNAQIVGTGTYDNGPVTITASPSGIVSIAPSSFTAPPSSAGDQNFSVTCINGGGGSVTISFNVQTSPDTTYASGLTYATGNYPGAIIGTAPFQCFGPS
jgi:hypothetical protein